MYLQHRSQRPAERPHIKFWLKKSRVGTGDGNRIADVYLSNYIRVINDPLSNQILLLVDITEINVFKDDEF